MLYEVITNTLALIESLPVSSMHVFPFSKRPGTPAAKMPEQLPGDIIKERAGRLRELAEIKQHDFAQRFVGKMLEVVVEAGERGGLFKGMSREYLEVWFVAGEGDVGRVRRVNVEKFDPQIGLVGSLLG